MREENTPFCSFNQQQISSMLKDMRAPTMDIIEQCCQEVRHWLETKTEYSKKVDDRLIYAFLFGTQFDVNSTKDKIDNYVHLSEDLTVFFNDRDPFNPALQLSSKITTTCILPKSTPDGYRVIYCQLADPSSKAYNVIDAYKRIFAQMDLLLSKDHCCRGYVFILSGKSAGLWHASHWTIELVRSLFDILVKSRPEEVIAWYFMDMNMILKPVFSVTLKVLTDENMRKKVYFNDKKHMAKILSKDILPKQYGGEGEYDFQKLNENWQTYLERNREFFLTPKD